MRKIDLASWIRQYLLNESGRIPPRRGSDRWWISNGYDSILKEIHEKTFFLNHTAPLNQRIHAILNRLSSKPVCPICNEKELEYRGPAGYAEFCSLQCSGKGRSRPEQNVMSDPTVRERHREAIRQTIAERNSEIKEKRKKTCLEKYGVEYVTQDSNFKAQINQSMIDRHGFDRYAHTPEFKAQMRKRTTPGLDDAENLRQLHHERELTHGEIARIYGVSESAVNHAMKRNGIEVVRFGKSTAEKELAAYIKSLYGEIKTNTRKIIHPKEIDIYIPSRNIAIEYDGLFYHSFDHVEVPAEKNYHLNKTENCLEKGIKLYHIFEDEWHDGRKEIWKSILNPNKHRIFARQLRVEKIVTPHNFFKENHLQGSTGANICYGLFTKDGELLSAMSFGKPRYGSEYEWEIIRFATKLNVAVVGGASKLFSAFEREQKPKSVITYADRRFSKGDVYLRLGFTHVRNTKPNYYYWKNFGQILSRIRCQKHKLASLLDTFNPELTEAENMFANKYRRFWDCGNCVFIKKY